MSTPLTARTALAEAIMPMPAPGPALARTMVDLKHAIDGRQTRRRRGEAKGAVSEL